MDVFPSEISASFSREVSCRGGGSAGREPKDSTSLFLTVNSKVHPGTLASHTKSSLVAQR